MSKVVEFKNVTYYKNFNDNIINWFYNKLLKKEVIVEDISFSIMEGESVGFLIDKQEVKTALLRLLTKNNSTFSGDICINKDLILINEINEKKYNNKYIYIVDNELDIEIDLINDKTFLFLSDDISYLENKCSRIIKIKDNKIEYDKEMEKNIVDEFLTNNDFMPNKSVETIYLHVGMPKTATSTIQRFAKMNYKVLNNKYNLFYPLCGGAANNGVFISSIMQDKPEVFYLHVQAERNRNEIANFNIKILEYYKKEVLNTKVKKIFISGESIITLNINELERTKIFFAKIMPNAKIKVIISVREPKSFIQSLYQQNIKAGFYTRDISNVCGCDYYRQRIGNILKIFNKEDCIIYKFEDSKDSGDIIKYFFELMNIEGNIINEKNMPRINESISDKAMDLLIFINNIYPFTINNRNNVGRYFQDSKLIEKISGNKYIIPDTEEVKDMINSNNDFLKKINIIYNTELINKTDTPQMKFDQLYYDEFIYAFDNVSDVLKQLMYLYIEFKIKESLLDVSSKDIFIKLQEYIKIKYPDIIKYKFKNINSDNFIPVEIRIRLEISNSIDDDEIYKCFADYLLSIGDLANAKTLTDSYTNNINAKTTNNRDILKKIGIKDDITDGELYRDIAVILESVSNIDGAKKYMEIAKSIRPAGEYISKKLDYYINILKEDI